MRGLVAIGSFPEGMAKRRALFRAGLETAKRAKTVLAATLVCEAWIKTLSPAEDWRARAVGPPVPSKAPDRRDAVILTARTLDGRVAAAYAFLGKDGGKARAGEWNVIECPERESGRRYEDDLMGFFFGGYILGMKAGT
jgi:hypothetical protein